MVCGRAADGTLWVMDIVISAIAFAAGGPTAGLLRSGIWENDLEFSICGSRHLTQKEEGDARTMGVTQSEVASHDKLLPQSARSINARV
jgi:hypothetical protein